jgi:tRNA 2-thiouridine synthesizing protein A
MSSKILIAIGMKCPRPLFEVHRVFKDLGPGEVLEVVADDPAFRLDIQAWCRRTGNELVELRAESDRFVAMIRKQGDSP